MISSLLVARDHVMLPSQFVRGDRRDAKREETKQEIQSLLEMYTHTYHFSNILCVVF